MEARSLREQLLTACHRGPSALRSEVRLLPPAEGTKVFPPTYAPPPGSQGSPRYAEEPRYIDGEPTPTVLLDSVPSQANRMEQALLAACRRGAIRLPLLQVEIPGHGAVTSLDAPQRPRVRVHTGVASMVNTVATLQHDRVGQRLTLEAVASTVNTVATLQPVPQFMVGDGAGLHPR